MFRKKLNASNRIKADRARLTARPVIRSIFVVKSLLLK